MGKRLPEIAANDIVTLDQGKSEVGALALTTMKPEEYAAAVFKPFNDKLAVEAAAADLIVFNEAGLLDLAEDIRPNAKVIDITTTAGMDIAVKYRAIFRDDIRLDSKKAFEARKAPVLSIGRLLDAGKKNIEVAVAPYESKFDNAIQAEIQRKADVKAEKDRVEAVRAAAIRAKIAEISSLPAKHARATAAQLTDALRELATREIMKEEFAEQTDDARAAVDTAAAELIALRDAATESEAATLAAEESRKAAEKRAAEEAAAVAKQKAENERIANEQAATAKRLADQEAAQALIAKQLADKAAANLRAENEARDTQVRLQREAQEKNRMALSQIEAIRHQAVIAEVGRSPYVKGGDAASYLFVLAETRAWVIDDEQFGVMTASAQMVKDSTIAVLEQGLASYIAADHADALIEDAQRDADREARREQDHLDSLAQDDAAAQLARCTETAKAMLTNGPRLPPPESATERDAMLDAGVVEVSDNDIINVVMWEFDWSNDEATKRMKAIDYAAAWQERLAEMEE